jgi:hypothetical protein
VLGQGPEDLAFSLVIDTEAAQDSPVGTYRINLGGLGSAAYAIHFVPGTYTVTPAPLVITADTATKVAGDPLPALTATYSGFVLGDTQASLSAQARLATDATASSPEGIYAIRVESAASPNYAITSVDGILTVTPAPALPQTPEPPETPLPVDPPQQPAPLPLQAAPLPQLPAPQPSETTQPPEQHQLPDQLPAPAPDQPQPTVPPVSHLTANEAAISSLYRDLLNRDPRPEELRVWSRALIGRITIRRMTAMIARSREYASLFADHVAHIPRPAVALVNARRAWVQSRISIGTARWMVRRP